MLSHPCPAQFLYPDYSWRLQIMKLPIVIFFPSACHFVSLRSNYCPQLTGLNHIILCSHLSMMGTHNENFTCLIDVCLVAVHVNMLGVHWMCISYKGDGVKISHVATDCCTLACGVMWSHKKIPVLLYSGMWHCIILSLGSIITIFWDVALNSSVTRFHHYHILGCGTE